VSCSPPVAALSPSDLDAVPRLGWVDEAPPVTPLPALAAELGLEFLGVKRDDLLAPLHGGSKPRKLDYLLAAPPFVDAPVWSAMGGIGSGQLVALTAAAAELGRRLHAYVFWTTVSAGVTDNLAFTASGPTEIFFHASRVSLALRRPWLFGAWPSGGRAVVPPGATSALGMVGLVRAGLELGAQIREGLVPVPDRVYVALGSGGTAAGLSVGLGLAGVPTTVAAIAVVERVLATRARLTGLQRQVMDVLARAGVPLAPPVPLLIDHAYLGRGYAEPTSASLAACEAASAAGVPLEPVYTGKALAALRAGAREAKLRNVVFWSTVRRDPIPHAEGWRARLPPPLARALADAPAFSRRLGRRRAMIAVGAAVTSAVALRLTGYPPLPGWRGEVLARWEAEVVTAAAEALLGSDATPQEIGEVAARVDRYLATMPVEVQREVHALIAVVEHGTPLGLALSRFTELGRAAREAYLSGLAGKGGLLAQVYGGLRDLVMLGYYQQPATFAAIGYDGPRQPLTYDPRGPGRWRWPVYDAMAAPAGAMPRAATAPGR
jgi:D-cysteine desulfhydrase